MIPNNLTQLTVRVATLDDARKLSPMLSFIENEEITADQVRARIEATLSTETPFLAEIDGLPAGFALLRIVPAISTAEPFAEITELYVEDMTQRESIGAKMAEQLEILAREKGASFLHLLTGLRNTGAKNIYRAMGYQDYALALRKRLK
jgi:ribosomal protein S18 acetylase RimI-like enzyme